MFVTLVGVVIARVRLVGVGVMVAREVKTWVVLTASLTVRVVGKPMKEE